MATIAWKNLFHDRTRLFVTLVGIVFALVLILVQFGLFLSFLETSSNIVANSHVDLWISAPSIPHVNGGSALAEGKRYQALSVPGVERVEKYTLMFVNWKLPTGAQEAVQVVGYPVGCGLGGPWNVTQGDLNDLRGEDTVMVDELYLSKLGVKGIGSTVEITGRRARVVGLTRGIRSFTTAPYVYTSFKNSQNYARLTEDQTIFFVVRTAPGADVANVKRALIARLKDVDVYTNEEMRRKTMYYWVLGTGAGVTTLLGAILGLIVGIVVVAQTIYAATVDHIREFGTLKAMGASNWNIYQVILMQAFLSALMGYTIAIAIGAAVAHGSQSGNVPIALPPAVAVGALLLAVVMCAGASFISIRKATQIDPAMVFKG
ncbi:MAG: FtsX-like permease family protein [Bryobacterales bacterium]|nr:FtsX-like permease family protein [Bryobacterales bacterium]